MEKQPKKPSKEDEIKDEIKKRAGHQGPISGAIPNSPSNPIPPDADTYGATATHTLATGSGTSGGFGSTGGSPASGSSDYPKPEGQYGHTTPGKKAVSSAGEKPEVHAGATRANMTGFQSEEADEGVIIKRISDLGDLLERAGERIERAGFSRIGDAIYRLGDRLEHLKRQRGPSNVKADDSVEVDQNVSSSRDTSKKPNGTRGSQAF